MSAKIKSTFFCVETDLAHLPSHEVAAIEILWKIPTIGIETCNLGSFEDCEYKISN